MKGYDMPKYKNYYNAISGDERIFTREDIANMTKLLPHFFDRKEMG